jgi:hypothetical protein
VCPLRSALIFFEPNFQCLIQNNFPLVNLSKLRLWAALANSVNKNRQDVRCAKMVTPILTGIDAPIPGEIDLT